jgi:putative membrane protein
MSVFSEAAAGDRPRRPLTKGPDSSGARRWIWGLSLLVVAGVLAVIYGLPERTSGLGPSPFASAEALCNGLGTALLLLGFRFVRNGNVRLHRLSMIAAFVVSIGFLVSYLLHHAQVGSVPYQGTGLLRVVYFALLIPHIVLAAAVVPLALFSIYRGYTGRVAAHKRIVRWTLPIWLYVSVSGVILYFMLYA